MSVIIPHLTIALVTSSILARVTTALELTKLNNEYVKSLITNNTYNTIIVSNSSLFVGNIELTYPLNAYRR